MKINLSFKVILFILWNTLFSCDNRMNLKQANNDANSPLLIIQGISCKHLTSLFIDKMEGITIGAGIKDWTSLICSYSTQMELYIIANLRENRPLNQSTLMVSDLQEQYPAYSTTCVARLFSQSHSEHGRGI